MTAKKPSAIELLQTIERDGCVLTLQTAGTAQKWITGKNLFMGISEVNGLALRNAYGAIKVEIPLRAANSLNWSLEGGGQAENLLQALLNTIKQGAVRTNSHFYGAMDLLAQHARIHKRKQAQCR